MTNDEFPPTLPNGAPKLTLDEYIAIRESDPEVMSLREAVRRVTHPLRTDLQVILDRLTRPVEVPCSVCNGTGAAPDLGDCHYCLGTCMMGSDTGEATNQTIRELVYRVHRAELAQTDPTRNSITIPRPHVPYGPSGMPVNEADAMYLREAADTLVWLTKNPDTRAPWGSNLTQTIHQLLIDCAEALQAPPAEPEPEHSTPVTVEMARTAMREAAQYVGDVWVNFAYLLNQALLVHPEPKDSEDVWVDAQGSHWNVVRPESKDS